MAGRRYPYSTNLSKNPLTFQDVCPAKASNHDGVPRTPFWREIPADEVHFMGEVWCVTLWEARANLIGKHGYAIGNELILQLVMDGMALCPPNPTFIEARDAILQADRVHTGGANKLELWRAFAKRGMGQYAVSGSRNTTSGVIEDFTVFDNLDVSPRRRRHRDRAGGRPLRFFSKTLHPHQFWSHQHQLAGALPHPLGTSRTPSGTLDAGAQQTVTVTLNAAAAAMLPAGRHVCSIGFSNRTTTVTPAREFAVLVGTTNMLTEAFPRGSG